MILFLADAPIYLAGSDVPAAFAEVQYIGSTGSQIAVPLPSAAAKSGSIA